MTALRPRVGFTRFDRWVFGLAAVAAAATGGIVWMSQKMISPPRPRVSESARPVLGLVLRPGNGVLEIVRAVPPASRAGLASGDRIVRLDGAEPGSPDDLAARVREAEPGHPFTIEASRPRADGTDAVMATVVAQVRTVSPADDGLPFEEVAFRNRDGLTLRGWFVPAPTGARRRAPTIVYGHGNGSDRRQWLFAAAAVHEAGFAQLLIDFAGRGESEGDVITLGARESGDLVDALGFARARSDVDPERCVLAGKSMGAAAALLAATDPAARVRGLVVDSPFTDLESVTDRVIADYHLPPAVIRPVLFRVAGWRAGFDPASVRPVEAIRRIRAPILLLQGDRDDLVLLDDARRFEQAAAGPFTMVVLEGLGHNTPRSDAIVGRIVAFLHETMGLRG